MRTLRSSFAGMVILVLLGGIGSTVLAQADDGQTGGDGPFSASAVDFVHADDMAWEPGPPFGRLQDWKLVLDVEATDLRLSGTWTTIQNGHGFGEPGMPDPFSVYTGTARLENEDGAWVGEVENFHSEAYERMRLVVEDEGAYAGLTAIIDQAAEFGEFQGVVFGGGLPPLPDLPTE